MESIELAPDEARVLGVLVEKAHTTPAQYPMTLNAVTTGCNQKSNRDPITSYDEDRVMATLDRLRDKGLVIMVDMAGSRVLKYKHNAREALGIGTNELVVLTELLLRGPQTAGELRGRTSRMHPLESMDAVAAVLDSLMRHDPPLARRVPPAPGGRAERFAQLLCPDLHPLDAPSRETTTGGEAEGQGAGAGLEPRVAQLEDEVAQLRQIVERLQQELGL